MKKVYLVCLLFSIIFVGCVSPTAINYLPVNNSDSYSNNVPKKIAIFFDGTANDPNSDTNVKQLHSLISLQGNRNEIATSYIKGVGTSGKVLGMAVGWGIGYDVREAYHFLINSYNYGDEIYIFGFSRGAYASRILSSLIYYAGIPDRETINNVDIKSLIDEIYSEYKGVKSLSERKQLVQSVFEEFKVKNFKNVRVKVLGLWDTVEALGWPDYEVNVDVPNDRYGDQLCNVDKAYHAVSIDDNRARVFTPILLTRKHLYNSCDDSWDNKKQIDHQKSSVKEVYFSGAHSDVGGGYNNYYLKGVSLNWMISNLESENLLPKNSSVPQNKYDKSHNPEGGIIWGLMYHELNRDIHKFVKDDESFVNKLKIHNSVFERLENVRVEKYEFKWLEHYKECFDEIGNKLKYKNSNICKKYFEIVYNK